MSVQSEIDRIKGNVAGAYSAVADMGGTLPEQQNSGGLEAAIRSIPSGGGGPADPLDPVEVYNATRPADWLPMPEPADNEMYLLFHIPDGVSSLLAFTVTCTGFYTVALGTVTGGQFVQQSARSVASGSKYEAELFAADFGDLTSDGFKQVMVKISGTDILTWVKSTHSKKTSPSNFQGWNIVEIACRLPKGTQVACGIGPENSELKKLKYFSWYGSNAVTNMNYMFYHCYSLKAILQLDTSQVTTMISMFSSCYNLTAIPQFDTSQVTNMRYTFYSCHSLTAIPQLDTAQVTTMESMFSNCCNLIAIPQLDTAKVTDMCQMLYNCHSLTAIPQLDTAQVTTMESMFFNCVNLTTTPQLDTSQVTNMDFMLNTCCSLIASQRLNTAKVTTMKSMFYMSYSLAEVTFTSAVTGWAGCAINLAGCSLGHQALVDLFNSLPTITSAKALTLTGNPGVAELTAAEKAIVTNKNWTLTL